VKAAAMFLDLLHRRPFESGNLRVALVAAVVFLNLNGFDVVARDEDLADLVALAAKDELSLIELSAAFEATTVMLDLPEEDYLEPL
jgi:prophage maintenance system killer protein